MRQKLKRILIMSSVIIILLLIICIICFRAAKENAITQCKSNIAQAIVCFNDYSETSNWESYKKALAFFRTYIDYSSDLGKFYPEYQAYATYLEANAVYNYFNVQSQGSISFLPDLLTIFKIIEDDPLNPNIYLEFSTLKNKLYYEKVN